MIGIVDTNSDPDPIEYIIPSNDDAIRAIKLICSKMADAALEGMAMREQAVVDEVTDFDLYEHEDFDGLGNIEDEKLLGESTLAKVRQAQEAEAKRRADQEEAAARAAEEEAQASEASESDDEVVAEVVSEEVEAADESEKADKVEQPAETVEEAGSEEPSAEVVAEGAAGESTDAGDETEESESEKD